MDIAASHIRPGITTDEIDEIVHNETIKRNAYPSPLNYRGYPKSVCTYVSLQRCSLTGLTFYFRSVNECICHGIPDKRKLQEGDIINIGTSTTHSIVTCMPNADETDVSLYYDGPLSVHGFAIGMFTAYLGFHADLNETYPVGRVDDDCKKLMRVTREALDEAIKICKPGALFRDLGKVMYAPPPPLLPAYAHPRAANPSPVQLAAQSSGPIADTASMNYSTAHPTSRTTRRTRQLAR